MQESIEAILRLFLFSENLLMIALVCLIVFLGNFFGGLLYSIIIAYSGPQRLRPLKERLSFKLSLMSELMIVIYAFYYHAILIHDIQIAQFFYWIFAMIIAPLLALLGAQITYVIFSKEIEANKRKLRQKESRRRAAPGARAESMAETVLRERGEQRRRGH